MAPCIMSPFRKQARLPSNGRLVDQTRAPRSLRVLSQVLYEVRPKWGWENAPERTNERASEARAHETTPTPRLRACGDAAAALVQAGRIAYGKLHKMGECRRVFAVLYFVWDKSNNALNYKWREIERVRRYHGTMPLAMCFGFSSSAPAPRPDARANTGCSTRARARTHLDVRQWRPLRRKEADTNADAVVS